MQRLIICKMLETRDLKQHAGPYDNSELWKNCEAQLKIARAKGCEVAHIYRTGRAASATSKVCRPLPKEAIYEAEIKSIFSYHPLEAFCTECATDTILLAGTIEQDILLRSMKEASYLGVTIATLPSASIIAARAPEVSPKAQTAIDLAGLCITMLRESARVSNTYPLRTVNENDEFHKNLGVAEISLLRWRTSLALEAGLLKPPESDNEA